MEIRINRVQINGAQPVVIDTEVTNLKLFTIEIHMNLLIKSIKEAVDCFEERNFSAAFKLLLTVNRVGRTDFFRVCYRF